MKNMATNDYERIEKVIRHLDRHHQAQPRLADLARIAGLSEFHFHRLFTRWAGTTPKLFLKSLTAAHARTLLRESKDLLTVALETGLSGPGRLHDLLVTVDGVTPGELKARGEGVRISYGVHDTPFGECLIGETPRGICHLTFEGKVADLRERWPRATFEKAQARTRKTVDAIFGGHRAADQLRVHLSGTPFQIKVWEALVRIPSGNVLSYGELAEAVGSPGAARAVGSAVGRNPIGFLIPCHRVIRETGVIGDYAWGTERKRAILAWESAKSPR